ncbi:purine-binding chemotaxis protein CheW [Clostridiales bacterium COT073_COT-073]|nr:purine-binding chemotaxis protein CheW [Clostridiales bacterium COT073_COT-073]
MENKEKQVIDSEAADQILKQYIVVRFNKEQFGISINYIQNIVRMTSITRVPNVPDYIKGVINLRGEIIPIMSLRIKLDLEPDEITNQTRIIIVNVDDKLVGLFVDEVMEVLILEDEQIEKQTKEGTDKKSKYISGVGKLEDRLISLFNVEQIIAD